jgi:hypothetical protein
MKTLRSRIFWYLAEVVEGLSIRLELLSRWLRLQCLSAECMAGKIPATPEAKREREELFDPEELKAQVEAHHLEVSRRLNLKPGEKP